MKTTEALNDTLNELMKFPLMEAIAGRRSRRFCMGAEIPDGVLAFKSKHKPLPLRLKTWDSCHTSNQNHRYQHLNTCVVSQQGFRIVLLAIL
jgi:hypothetical protein